MELEFFLNVVVIAPLRVTTDEFTEETGHKQLGSQNHHGKRDIEIGRGGDQRSGRSAADMVEFNPSHHKDGKESHDKH